MASNNETTTKFKVDISELKAGITEANRQIKLANAQFKSAAAAMDDWSDSADGLEAKISQTTTVLNAQKTILNSYKQQLALIVQEYGENSAQADNMRIKIENQRATVIKTQKALGDYQSQLAELEKAQGKAGDTTEKQISKYDELKKSIDTQQSKLNSLKSEYSKVVLEQGKNSDSAKELAKEISDLSGELSDNKKQLSEVDKAADSLDKSLDNASSGGLSAFTVALGNLAANVVSNVVGKMRDMVSQTIEVGKAFDSSMSNVAALSGATADELEMLRDTAKEYGSTTKFSASEAADALGYMALAGWDANTSASALGGVLDLAAASGMDLAEASDMVTDYMSAFNMEASQSAYFADLMAYAQANANTTVDELGEAFKNCAANMNAAGQDVETTTSLLSMMANQGFKGSEAGTALTAVMRDMTSKMKDGAIAIGDTSVQVMDANGNYRDMTDIMLDVEKATQGMGDAEKAAALQSTFTSDSIKGLNLILNAGVGNAADFEAELRNSTGTASEMSKVMNDNLSGDMTALNSQLEGVQIALYEKFEPALRAGVSALSGLLDGFQWLVDHGDGVATVITSVASAVGVFMLYIKRQAIMTAFTGAITAVKTAFMGLNATLMANPIGIVIAAITGLVVAFTMLWNKSDKFRNFWISIWNNIKTAVGNVWNFISPIFEYIGSKFNELANTVATIWTTYVQPVIAEIGAVVTDVWENVLQPVFNAFASVFQWLWDVVVSVILVAMASQFALVWNGIQALWDNILHPVFDAVGDTFKWLWDNILSPTLSVLGDTFKGVFDDIKWIWDNVLHPVFKAIGDVFQKIWDDHLKPVIDSISTAFKNMSDTISDIWTKLWDDTLKPVINGILGGIETLANGVVSGMNKIIKALNNLSFDIPDWVPEFGGKKFGFNLSELDSVSLPRLQNGGVLAKGQVGLLEGNGAEAVVPLENNAKWIAATAQDLKKALISEGILGAGNVQQPTVTNNYNYTQNNTSPKALDRLSIYRDTKSLLFDAQVRWDNV